MAVYIKNKNNSNPSKMIKIIGSQMIDDHTVYTIQIDLGEFRWTVNRRYREFYELNEKLLKEIKKLDKDLLPKKQVFGTHSVSFIQKRRASLQIYLQSLFRSLFYIPPSLSFFLDFYKYEIHGLTEALSEELYKRCETLLASKKFCTLSTLQMHAICTRLELPEPTCNQNVQMDLGHLLEFISRLKYLQVIGEPLQYESSNIKPNNLPFSLFHFKSLQTLKLVSCNVKKITISSQVKRSLRKIIINKSITKMKDILLNELLWEKCEGVRETLLQESSWGSLIIAVFNNNNITSIDDSLLLMPRVEKLVLNNNQISNIEFLFHLLFLKHLDLSHNLISSLENLHLKIGNITYLNLSHNKISSLTGLSKMYSLVTVDISNNKISDPKEAENLKGLPCLESLDLRKNPLCSSIDYRLNVLTSLFERYPEINLDNIKMKEKEYEVIRIRMVVKRSSSSTTSQLVSSIPNLVSYSLSPSFFFSSSSFSSQSFFTSSSTSNSILNKTSDSDQYKVSTQSSTIIQANSPSTNNFINVITPNEMTNIITNTTSQILANNSIKTPKENAKLFSSKQTTFSFISKSPLSSFSNSCPQLPPSSAEGTLESSSKNELVYLGFQDFSSQKKSLKKEKSKYFLLPDTLPNHSDKSLVAFLQPFIASSISKYSVNPKSEVPLCIFWCHCSFDNQMSQFKEDLPCCLSLTPRGLLLMEVREMQGHCFVPKMTHLTFVHFASISCFLIGFKNLYLRIVSKNHSQTLLTILTFSASKTEHLFEQIKVAYRWSVHDLDLYEDPLLFQLSNFFQPLFYSSIQPYELDLKIRSSDFNSDSMDVSFPIISFFQLVQLIYPQKDVNLDFTSCLLATENNLYLIKHDFSYFPPLSSPHHYVSYSNRKDPFKDQIICVFPLKSKVINIQLYDGDSIDVHFISKTNSFRPHSDSNFIGYGLKISFNLGFFGTQVLDLRWPSSNLRDLFLTWFIQARNEIKEPSLSLSTSLLVKDKLKRKFYDIFSTAENDDKNKNIFEKREKDGYDIDNEESGSSQNSSSLSHCKESFLSDNDLNIFHQHGDLASHNESNLISTTSFKEMKKQERFQSEGGGEIGESSIFRGPPSEGESQLTQRDKDLISEDFLLRMKSLTFDLNKFFPSMQDLFSSSHKLRAFLKRYVIKTEAEFLKHILFCHLVLHQDPSTSFPCCVFLTNFSLYFFTNFNSQPYTYESVYSLSRPHSLYVINKSEPSLSLSLLNFNNPLLNLLFKVNLHQLLEVDLGMFAQFFRLLVRHEDEILITTCLTRDSRSTQFFLHQLLNCLSNCHPSHAQQNLQESAKEIDSADIYSMFQSYSQMSDNGEVKFYYNVKFIYPGDDIINDLSLLSDNFLEDSQVSNEIRNTENSSNSDSNLMHVTPCHLKKFKIFNYLSCFFLDFSNLKKFKNSSDLSPSNFETLYIPLVAMVMMLTSKHLIFLTEDVVSYPIPDSIKFPPKYPQFEVKHKFSLKKIRTLTLFNDDDNLISVGFEIKETKVGQTLEKKYEKRNFTETKKEKLEKEEREEIIDEIKNLKIKNEEKASSQENNDQSHDLRHFIDIHNYNNNNGSKISPKENENINNKFFNNTFNNKDFTECEYTNNIINNEEFIIIIKNIKDKKEIIEFLGKKNKQLTIKRVSTLYTFI